MSVLSTNATPVSFSRELISPEQIGKPNYITLLAKACLALAQTQEIISEESRKNIQFTKKQVLDLAGEQANYIRSSAKWNVIISAGCMGLTTLSIIPSFEKLAGFIEPARSMGITWVTSGYDAKIVGVQTSREIEMQELSRKINDNQDSSLTEERKRMLETIIRTLQTASAA